MDAVDAMTARVAAIRADIDAMFAWVEAKQRQIVEQQRLADGPEEDVA